MELGAIAITQAMFAARSAAVPLYTVVRVQRDHSLGTLREVKPILPRRHLVMSARCR